MYIKRFCPARRYFGIRLKLSSYSDSGEPISEFGWFDPTAGECKHVDRRTDKIPYNVFICINAKPNKINKICCFVHKTVVFLVGR